MPHKFAVSYEIVSQDSATQGDWVDSGWIDQAIGLREAIEYVHQTRTSAVGDVESIEADSRPVRGFAPRWVTVTNGIEFRTGEQESRTLYILPTVTSSSARRIARLIGVRG